MHSILFRIGPVTIFSYGFMLMLAFVVGTALAMREARRKGLDADAILDLAPWVLVASVVGARLVFAPAAQIDQDSRSLRGRADVPCRS